MLYNELLDGISRIVPGSRVIEKFGTEIKVNLPPRQQQHSNLREPLRIFAVEQGEMWHIIFRLFRYVTGRASDFEFCQNGSGRATLPNQLKTMLLKRVWRNRRNKMELCMQLMMKGRDLSTQFDTSQKMTRNRSQSHFFERRTHDNSSISGAVQNYIKKAKTDRGRTCVSRRNCAKNKNQLSRGLDKKNGSDLEKIMINISGKRDVPTSDSDINDNIKYFRYN
ncbi:unnamed protein product [Nesidiocoris tenuis]|uniref:Uncharacterized protein n=1 Tax=Nesidiocoris tenuis TaxID=355587 RepID=A0A6H5H2T2_9HEMI|nr:unnamed protein product [Nesidiocoris tenuis]